MKGENLNTKQLVQDTIDAYNYLADKYTQEWSSKVDTENTDFFLEQLSPGSRVLDAGCGPGHYARYFNEKGMDAHAIDLSDEMLRNARNILNPQKVQKMDLRNLTFEDNSFDAIWTCASSPHIPKEQIPTVLKGLKRILKKDGILFINAIIGNRPYRLETADEIAGGYQQNGRFFQWYSGPDEFQVMLEEEGFEVFEVKYKTIYSDVVQEANHRVNQWYNFYGRNRK